MLRTSMLRTRLSAPVLDDAFAARWQALAAAAGASAFLSWTWVGCLAAERLTAPLLVEALDGETLVGQALFNRIGDTLHLHSTGNAAQDGVFIEHNGAVATNPGAFAAMLRAVAPVARRVVLPGIGHQQLTAVRAAGGIVVGHQVRPAPYAALPVGRFSRNTRAQLGRSDRSYAAYGPILVERAGTSALAEAWLDAMLPMHAAAWASRGVASGFLAGPVQRFTRALLAHGVSRNEVDMLRITAGPRLVGILLNLRGAGCALAYQGGFDYAGAGPHEKPGLTCHHAAMRWADDQRLSEYDLLAGDARYKHSLATASRDLHWLTWKPRPVLFGLEAVVRRAFAR